MSFEPRVSDVLTTEENRSHYHGKPWKWEGKCLHATPAPFPAHPLISPSRSALTVTRVLLPEINGHCASAGVIESPACGAGSTEGSAFLLPPPQPRRRARCQIHSGTGCSSLQSAGNKSTAHMITRIPQGLGSPSTCGPPAAGWVSTAGWQGARGCLSYQAPGPDSPPENRSSICNSNPGGAED